MNPNPLADCSFAPDGSVLLSAQTFADSSRRDFLLHNGIRFGALGLSSVLGSHVLQAEDTVKGPLAPKQPHFKAKATAVIQIFAAGGPSQVDTWDPKPELEKNSGKKLPGYQGLGLGSPFKFSKMGQSGIEVSEVFPELGKQVDDMAIIRSLFTEIPDHNIASKMLMTGAAQLIRPSVGAWTTYGLGSMNQSLPGFITLGGDPVHRQAAFFPGLYGGCNVKYSADLPLNKVVENITSRVSTPERQRAQIDFAKELNRMDAEAFQKDIQLETRIQAFEIAYTMQKAAMDAFDINNESAATREMYSGGRGKSKKVRDLGAKLLIARRLVERGVRYVQITHGGWDHHTDIHSSMVASAEELDAPAAALIKDLKQKGLFDQTLIVWGGEIGRTVTGTGAAGELPGRDHNGQALCAWMAGGGVKGGTTYGMTDEFGGRAVENKMHIHDLHATMLALLGLDHKRLTYNYNGRDFRLTDNYGSVVRDLIA